MIEQLNEMLPTYEVELPFSKKKAKFTPFKVKDAKNIAIVLQEDNKKLALIALVNILKNCCKDISIADICLADAEFLFLQIRGKSIEEFITLTFNNTKKQVNINDLKFKNNLSNKEVKIGSNIIVTLETPKLKDLLNLDTLNKEDIIKASIKTLSIQNEIYDVSKFVPQELKNVLDNLPLSFAIKTEEFLKEQPELYVELDFDGEKKEVSGILNFFTYR